MRTLGLVGQDGVAREERHRVVAVPGVHPHRLLHGRADGDDVVAAERIDDDGDEIALRRQQIGLHLLLLILERRRAELVALRRAGAGLFAQRGEVGVAVHRVPDRVARAVGGVEIELHLGGEGEVAVVVREPGDQVEILEQPRLRHEVHVDHVVGIRATVIPDLVALLRVFLPVVAREAAVQRLEP